MTIFNKSLQQRLSTAEPFMLNIFIVAAVFSTYFCAYGFRKPFTAGSFDLNFTLPLIKVTLSYKILLVVVQTLGYATAKFAGIKLIAEAKKNNLSLVRSIVALLTIAGLSWVLWAITPPPYNLVFIFINGFPLGLIWGLVLSFIEGRKYTELFGTGLSASFIFAAAFSQQLGQAVLNQGVSEYWMPLYVSGIYFVPMLIVAWLLGHTPPPNAEDVRLRKERQPMDSTQRKSFMRV
ncbi:membrane protein, putative [Microscilla marina ATCC 23134]|uniref:Membrane protein, putative n=1 Tax=Microscilla marina ATCC 23134 TaxID=313606 RepID=A1ZSE7_MICM2|nr:membrane protein, putative [Microscilla marina ATCC 23134]